MDSLRWAKAGERERERVALQYSAKAHGQRVQKAGMERMILQGTISRNGESETPIAIVHQTPGRLRVEEQSGVLGVDAIGPWRASGSIGKEDTALLESLLNDTAEEFFARQATFSTAQLLGSYFRMDDSPAAGYKGPYYNIYDDLERQAVGEKVNFRRKLHCINSDTQLWEMVRYVIESGGGETRVETKVTWREQSGEMVPATITRLENGRVAAKLTVRSVSFAAQSNDGLFDGPKAGRP